MTATRTDSLGRAQPVRAPAKSHPRHGSRSTYALAPLVLSMKKAILARMGLRQRDLGWQGRELLDTYARCKAKIVAVDRWLETHPLIDETGKVPAALSFYGTWLNTSIRALDALRSVIADLDRSDRDIASALSAIEAEERGLRPRR